MPNEHYDFQPKEQPSFIERVENAFAQGWDHLMGTDVKQMKKEITAATEADKKYLPDFVIQCGDDGQVVQMKKLAADDAVVQKKKLAADDTVDTVVQKKDDDAEVVLQKKKVATAGDTAAQTKAEQKEYSPAQQVRSYEPSGSYD